MTAPGKKTAHTGIRRLGEQKFHLRVTMRHPQTQKKVEKEMVVDGLNIRQAEKRWEQLREELQAAVSANAILPQRTRCDETVEAFVKRWIEHAVTNNRYRNHVLDRVTANLDQYVVPYLGGLSLSDINPQTLTK